MTQSYDLKWRIQGHKICDWDILSLPRSQFPAYGQWVLAEDLWNLCLSWNKNLMPGARCLTFRRAGLLWVDKKRQKRNSSQETWGSGGNACPSSGPFPYLQCRRRLQ